MWIPALRRTPESNYWKDREEGRTQINGGYKVKLLWGIYPPNPLPPGFSTPGSTRISPRLNIGNCFARMLGFRRETLILKHLSQWFSIGIETLYMAICCYDRNHKTF